MNYYNEHDPNAAAVLRELIRAGEIPLGDVDETDIQNVKPTRLAGYTQCHFFAGFGGWMEALNLAGWPDTEPVWTGSCPCQPFSTAGSGLCEADERHLWPDFRNLIAECRPAIVFGEQVAGEDGRVWLAGVSTDMEAMGYQFAAADLCAAGVGSPQKRQRIYWGGSSNSNVRVGASRCTQRNVRNVENRHWENVEWVETSDGRKFRNQPGLSLLAHGVPKRVVYLRGFGNAICPPLAAEFIGAWADSANAEVSHAAGRTARNSIK